MELDEVVPIGNSQAYTKICWGVKNQAKSRKAAAVGPKPVKSESRDKLFRTTASWTLKDPLFT